MVVEPKDLKSLCLDSGRALRISSFTPIGEVLTAVELDDELCGVANKVGDIVLDGDLTTKTNAA